MLNVYSVYDSKAQTYNTPFFMKQDGQALRAFIDLANDNRTDVAKHPEDYSLFLLASFDDEDGVIDPIDTPKCIAKAWELIAQNNEAK